MKTCNVSTVFSNIPTDVTVFASRGKVFYGFCLTPQHDVALVELLKTELGNDLKKFGIHGVIEYVRKDTKLINFGELQAEPARLLNRIETTVSCFIANAYLKEPFPELEKRVLDKILQMVKEIPKPEVYSF